MTPNAAKKIVQSFLDGHNIADVKLSAKTVSFQDLARDEKVFVTLKNWRPDPIFADLKELARKNGFCVIA